MQPLSMLDQAAIQPGCHRLIDICDICDDRPDAQILQAAAGAEPHAAAEQHLAISDGLGHAGVPVAADSIEPVRRPGRPIVFTSRKMLMVELVAHFAGGHHPILDSNHQLVQRSAEMRADYLAVIGHTGNFHRILPF